MRVLKTNFQENPNIGLYCYCSNKYCLLPYELASKYGKEIAEILQVPVYGISAVGTSLIGAFLAGNDNCLLIPDLMFKYERDVLDKHKIKYKVIKTKNTALGNSICANNNGAIVSHDFEPNIIKEIEEALNVPVKKTTIAGLDIAGSTCAANNRTALAHNKITSVEKKKVETLLKVKVLPTLIDSNPYVHAGIILNDSGYIITSNILTKELVIIDQTLNE